MPRASSPAAPRWPGRSRVGVGPGRSRRQLLARRRRRGGGRPPSGPRLPDGSGRGRPRGSSTILVGSSPWSGWACSSGRPPSPAGRPARRRLRRRRLVPPGACHRRAVAAGTPTPSGRRERARCRHIAGGAVAAPLSLVADVRDLREGISAATLTKEIAAGRVALPCGLTGLAIAGDDVALTGSACLTPAGVTTAVRSGRPRLGLLPPALVTPRVKVLRVAGADLFGPPSIRALDYPVVGRVRSMPASWAGFDVAEVRTLISTGDTCPDRGVSHQTNTLRKGWDWALDGGTARYTGTHVDRRFDGPDGNGWPVVDAVRSGNEGAVRTLISDAEITIDDFECPMTSSFRQHDTGTVFSIDPRVAPLLARAGVDVVTLASTT